MDYLAIADALADRYDPGIVVPPVGLKNITTATARPPNAIPNTPFVIAWATEGELTLPPGQMKGDHTFMVTFYYAKSEADIPREYTALLSWLGVLLGRLNGAMKLGIATGVMKALLTKWEMGSVVYAGYQFEAITLTVHVYTEEAVSLVP